MFNEKILKSDERAIFTLRNMYKHYGYLPFKMSKFEEYDLYVRNKDFLVSEMDNYQEMVEELVVEEVAEAIEGVSEDSIVEVQQEEAKEIADVEPEPEVQEQVTAPDKAPDVASEPQDPIVPEPEPVVEAEPAPTPTPAPATPNVEVKTEQQAQNADAAMAEALAKMGMTVDEYNSWQSNITQSVAGTNTESVLAGTGITFH